MGIGRKSTDAEYGRGQADVSGGVAQNHVLGRFMFSELLRQHRNSALGILDTSKHSIRLKEGQVLTPDPTDPAALSPLYFPQINESLRVNLFAANEDGKDELIAETSIGPKNTVPTASWFTGVAEGVMLPPSFKVTSAAEQEAWTLAPLAEFMRRGHITPEDAINLIQGASREFSSWLSMADADEVTKHPDFTPLMVSTLTPRTWQTLSQAGKSRQIPARTVVTPTSLQAEKGSAIAIRTRGQWFGREAVERALTTRNIDGLEITPGQFRDLLKLQKPFATVGEASASGSTFIFESAALQGEKAPSVFIPVTAAQAVVIPIGTDNVPVAARVLKDIQGKNADMMRHIATSRLDLGLTSGGKEDTIAGQLSALWGRLWGNK